MDTLQVKLRLARRGELAELVRIDDAACEVYASAGIQLELGADHPFVIAEQADWQHAIESDLVHLAVDASDHALGFMALRFVDGLPHLEQLSVVPSAMRQGIGTRLLQVAIEWSGTRALWLTTYAHVPWNRPYYERHGFRVVSEAACGPEVRALLQDQRAVLPAPEQRVAMARPGA